MRFAIFEAKETGFDIVDQPIVGQTTFHQIDILFGLIKLPIFGIGVNEEHAAF